MRWLARLFGFASNNGSVVEDEPDLEESEDDGLQTGDVKDLCDRIRDRASQPINTPAEQQRMKDEIAEGTQAVMSSSEAVQDTLTVIDEELEKKAKKKEASEELRVRHRMDGGLHLGG